MKKIRHAKKWLPEWAENLLACPTCGRSVQAKASRIVCTRCGTVGQEQRGVLRFGAINDDNFKAYRHIKGASLHERTKVPFTTSSLDAPVYASLMEKIKPADPLAIVVDVGAGDGRNTQFWLEQGFRRVIAVDANIPALLRLRDRIKQNLPESLPNLLLLQADARHLPLAGKSCHVVLAIESLEYAGEDYEKCVAECARVLKKSGRMMLSSVAAECGLMCELLYGGIQAMIQAEKTGIVHFGAGKGAISAKLRTEKELRKILRGAGLRVLRSKGLSGLAPLLGFLRTITLDASAQALFPVVVDMLKRLSAQKHFRRVHVLFATR